MSVFLLMSVWQHWGFPLAWAGPGSEHLQSFNLDLLCDLRKVTSSLSASIWITKSTLGDCPEGKITVCDRDWWRGKLQIQGFWFCLCFETISVIKPANRCAWPGLEIQRCAALCQRSSRCRLTGGSVHTETAAAQGNTLSLTTLFFNRNNSYVAADSSYHKRSQGLHKMLPPFC